MPLLVPGHAQAFCVGRPLPDAMLPRVGTWPVGAIPPGSDLQAALSQFARNYLRFVIRPEVLRLRRLVIGEAGRFPELASQYYERVPERIYGALADLLRRLTEEGRLAVPDPEMAAQHLTWLLLGWPLDRGMFFELKAATAGIDWIGSPTRLSASSSLPTRGGPMI